MYAVIQTGGKQYKVKQGQLLKIETLVAEEGKNVEFDQVLMVGDAGNVKVGTPNLKDAKVLATVIQHGRHKKINILKFKRRKHHLKRMGHRQNFTEVKITDIKG